MWGKAGHGPLMLQKTPLCVIKCRPNGWKDGLSGDGVVLQRRARYVVDNHFLAVSWHVCRLINPWTILKALSWFLPVHAFGTIKSHLDGTCNFVGSSISARLFTFQYIEIEYHKTLPFFSAENGLLDLAIQSKLLNSGWIYNGKYNISTRDTDK